MAKGITQNFRLRPEHHRLAKLARINITDFCRGALLREVEKRLGITLEQGDYAERKHQRTGKGTLKSAG